MSKLIVLCMNVTLLAGLAASAPVSADAGYPAPEKIQYSRAELGDTAGITRLYRRLELAAASVCRYYDSQELSRHVVFERCTRASLTNAVAQIHEPALTAYYEHKVGTAPAVAITGLRAAAP